MVILGAAAAAGFALGCGDGEGSPTSEAGGSPTGDSIESTEAPPSGNDPVSACSEEPKPSRTEDDSEDLTGTYSVTDEGPIEVPVNPATDLTRVSVRSNRGFLCVGFETAAPSTPATMFQLLMREPNEDDAGNLVTLEVQSVGSELESVAPDGFLVKTNAPAPDALATLSEADQEAISDDEAAFGPDVIENAVSGADVRQSGNLLSVAAPWSIFDSALRPMLRDFEWQVIAWYTPPEEERVPPDLQFLDCAPEFPYRVSLNERRRVEVKGNVAPNC